MTKQEKLLQIYSTLYSALGPSYWWPGNSAFEIALGAILTQNTNWNNVEKAILNLKKENLLDEKKLFLLSEEKLANLIRPAGFYRLKTKRIKNFLHFLNQEANLNLVALKKKDLAELRPKLLSIKGIGPETADSILLYALEKPIFVVDAYTKRLLNRHGLVPEETSYEEVQDLFMNNLEPNVELYNEYHALIVRAVKKWCHKKNPKCDQCPLKNIF
ncbi:MAG: HhH-GPD family protein [Desulfonauticus sp. 38_4375]|nr:MAG: HhH-GPD family protein [Desulfonauticus sp. 38_4375]